MKILFLTDNFPPESNAPATRTHEHCRHWARLGHRVVVITCAPNFPRGRVFEGYRNRLFQRERIDGVEVIRVWSYITANEGFFLRILDYVSFMVAATLASFVVRRPDVVIATSPQFFTAVAGWLVSTLKRRPFVFELRDLWPETIVAVDAMKNNAVLRMLERFAHWLYRRADLMVPVTQTFAARLAELGIPEEKICVVTNGIDADSIAVTGDAAAVRARHRIPAQAFVAGYVGTIGMCHGLNTIIEAAIATRERPQLHYLIMGEGADKAEVKRLLRERELHNVTLLDGQPRREALEVVGACDASLVMLRNSPVFETVIPSKMFEAMALRKPIALGVRGEARRIVVDEVQCGVAFTPEDAAALVGCLDDLRERPQWCRELAERGYAAVQERFRRERLAKRMLLALERRFGPRPGPEPGPGGESAEPGDSPAGTPPG